LQDVHDHPAEQVILVHHLVEGIIGQGRPLIRVLLGGRRGVGRGRRRGFEGRGELYEEFRDAVEDDAWRVRPSRGNFAADAVVPLAQELVLQPPQTVGRFLSVGALVRPGGHDGLPGETSFTSIPMTETPASP
jgi:hypothetical protein